MCSPRAAKTLAELTPRPRSSAARRAFSARQIAQRARVKGDATPADLEAAWQKELERLRTEPVSEHELQKVKNRVAADSYRQLQSNSFLRLQLGYYEALRSWKYLNEGPKAMQAVTAEDILRVVNEYFVPTNRSVATYTRFADSEPEDPMFAALAGPITTYGSGSSARMASVHSA